MAIISRLQGITPDPDSDDNLTPSFMVGLFWRESSSLVKRLNSTTADATETGDATIAIYMFQ